ncbi:MAG TPA: hypothetical protein VGJ57_09005 [Nitrospirales bacterium]
MAVWPSRLLACTVTVELPDVDFPLEKMDGDAVCRLAEVVNDYTTYQMLPLVHVPINRSVYEFLLDHPALTSNAVRYYKFGGYVVTEISPTVFTGVDREGGEATVTLLYQDTTRRVYHLRGSQRGQVIPTITGAGILMLSYQTARGSDGREGIDTKVTVFSRLDNRFLANLVKLLRPILQGIINNKLTKGVKTVNRTTEFLAGNAEEVSRDADKFASDAGQARNLRAVLLSSSKGGG